MASFQCIGIIDAIKLLPESCVLFITERKSGYKKQNGEFVDEKFLQWRIIYGGYFKKYLVNHFGKGMLVEVKGEILPYTIEHNQQTDGFSILGQTCNVWAYPKYGAKREAKMIKDSQENGDGVPDLDEYNKPDF